MDENKEKIELDKDTKYALDIINSNNERQIKRLWTLIALLIIILVGTNVGWIVYEAQFEDVSTEVTQDIQSVSGNTTIEHNYPGAVINDKNTTDDKDNNTP